MNERITYITASKCIAAAGSNKMQANEFMIVCIVRTLCAIHFPLQYEHDSVRTHTSSYKKQAQKKLQTAIHLRTEIKYVCTKRILELCVQFNVMKYVYQIDGTAEKKNG